MISFQFGVLGCKKERRPGLDTESAAVKHPPGISQVVENRPIPDTPDFHLSISLALGPIASGNGWGRESSTDSNTARSLDGVAASSGRQSFSLWRVSDSRRSTLISYGLSECKFLRGSTPNGAWPIASAGTSATVGLRAESRVMVPIRSFQN